MELDFKAIQNDLLSSILFAVSLFGYARIGSWLSRRSFANLAVFTTLLILWFILDTFVLCTLAMHNFSKWIVWLAALLLFGLLLALLRIEFGSPRFIGISGVDKRIKSGLSYDKALSL